MKTITLAQEHLLDISDGGARRYGADQEWYRQFWRRKAGCGPTTASVQMAYLARTRPALSPLCPLDSLERESFSSYMDQVWSFVTPGVQGLNTIGKYCAGVSRFAAQRDVPLRPLALEVPAPGAARPSLEQCLSFLREGLEENCPVAFLNLDRGRVPNLDGWHWVLLTGMRVEEDRAMAVMADAGRRSEIELSLWYHTTKAAGGFVRLRGEDL